MDQKTIKLESPYALKLSKSEEKHNWAAISLGAYDTPTITKLKQHIFVAEKDAYYEIADSLPQIEDVGS